MCCFCVPLDDFNLQPELPLCFCTINSGSPLFFNWTNIFKENNQSVAGYDSTAARSADFTSSIIRCSEDPKLTCLRFANTTKVRLPEVPITITTPSRQKITPSSAVTRTESRRTCPAHLLPLSPLPPPHIPRSAHHLGTGVTCPGAESVSAC